MCSIINLPKNRSKNHPMKNDSRTILSLGILTTFCFLLEGLRIYYAQSNQYLFLLWNLFLAGIPLAIALITKWSPRVQGNKWMLLTLLLLWLLFFPNAPYIITDLKHLRPKSPILLWYDAFLIFSFAWTGLLYGLHSLHIVQQLLAKRHNAAFAWICSGAALLLCAIGIYIGRFLRWNSWDIINDPMGILSDTYHSFTMPFFDSYAWSVSIICFLFLLVSYLWFELSYSRVEDGE